MTSQGEREHELKTDPDVFRAVWYGHKTFEIRFDDREFRVGDRLFLRETEHTGEEMKAGAPLVYTGFTTTKTVSHILHGYGLQPGWVCLSFSSSTVQQVGTEWQPIETAPEGTLILCCNMKAAELRHWAFVDWLSQGKFCGNQHNKATHWMHLPAAPKSDGGMGS